MPFFTFLAAIGEAIAGAVGSAAVAAGAGGTLAGALGTAAEFGIGGAVLGAGESALMGKNPLQGAEAGLIGGAVTGGLGGLLGSSLGSTAGGAVAGALGGGLGSLATGTNPLTGALTGGVGGGIAGSMGGLGGAAPGGAQSAVSALGPTYDPTQAFTTAADATSGGLPNISGDLTQGVPSLGGTSGTIGPTTQLDALGRMASGAPVSAMGNAPVDTPSGGSIFSNLFGGNGAGAGGVASVGSPAVPGTMATGNINTPAPGLDGAASGGASGAAGAGGIKNLFSDPLGTIKANPGLALAGLGMGYDVLKGNQMPKGYAQLEQQANTLTAEANQLTQGALNNALPPEAQAQLDQAQNSAMQQIRSKYAQMGLSGSSMEAQAQAGVNEAMASQGYSIMQQLMSQGLSAAQAANAALTQIMNANVTQSAATSGAIGNFAGALAGSSTKGA